MKTVSKILFLLMSALLCFSAAYSAIPNTDHPRTFLGPTAKGSITNSLNQNTAFSILGEAGFRNFRLGGTVGYIIDPNQRIKLSADYLHQKITYPFFSGNTSQWMDQASIGAVYEYDLSNFRFNPAFDLRLWFSHAPNKGLGTVRGTFFNDFGIMQNFVNLRRIAGSNAGGIAPGVVFYPWMGGKAGAELNYDKVHYDTKYGRNHDAIGFGGTLYVDHAVSDDLFIGASAAIRKPFNNYQAHINWMNVPLLAPGMVVGVAGAYTAGKNTLPSTYDASVNFDYFVDGSLAPSRNRQSALDFLAWTRAPALYLPQVLAIPDERVIVTDIPVPPPPPPVCPLAVPTFTGTIADLPFAILGTFATAPFFTGESLTFTLNIIDPPAIPGTTQVIDPVTGVITYTDVTADARIVSVTATNACGSATSNAFTIG